MLLEDLNWMDVENYLKHDDRIILVTGTCEQHGSLSLLTDVKIPMAIATIAAEREGVLVAPPINYGVSPHFAAFPGTIAIRVETFQRVVQDVVGSLFAQGFKRIFVLNGHGGNKIAETLVELANAHSGLQLDWLDWWQHPIVEEIAKQHGLEKGHANWMENFAFTRVTDDMPQGVKPRVQLPATADAAATRRLLGDGSYGGAYQAADEVMDQLLEAVVGVVQERLSAMPIL
jgi:creatinine amidohydrolase